MNKNLKRYLKISLLTTIAKCCKPLPGDKIIGYITQGRGISIHRVDCRNIKDAIEKRREKLIDVEWGDKNKSIDYAVDVFATATERPGLLKDITSLLSSEKINITRFESQRDYTLFNSLLKFSLQYLIRLTQRDKICNSH